MGTTQTLPLPILPVDAVIELEGLDNCDDQLHLRSPLTANVLVNRIRSKKVLLENASSSRARTRKRPPRSTGQAKSRSSAAASPSSPLPEGDTRRADGDPRYEGIDPSLVPAIECLADVVERTHLCYSAEILPNLQATGVSGGAALSSPTPWPSQRRRRRPPTTTTCASSSAAWPPPPWASPSAFPCATRPS